MIGNNKVPVLPLSPCCHPCPLGVPACSENRFSGTWGQIEGEGRWLVGGALAGGRGQRLRPFISALILQRSASLISQELTTGHSRKTNHSRCVTWRNECASPHRNSELFDVIGVKWSTATRVALNEQCKFLFQCYINKVWTYEMNQHFKPNKYELLGVLNEIY